MIVNLLDIVNKRLTDNAVAAVENKERDYTHFHPSEWDNCKRKIAYAYYEAMGFIEIDLAALKVDPRSERIFDNGHSMHDRWRKYMSWTNALLGRWMCLNHTAHKTPKIHGLEEKLGIPKPSICDCGASEFEYVEVGFLDPETLWGGHVDAIIDNEIAGITAGYEKIQCSDEERFLVVDFKTMNDYEFRRLEDPKPQHNTQMQIYLYLSGLKYGKFLYENKNNQETKEFLVPRDDRLLEVKKAEALSLKSLVETPNSKGGRSLPKRGYDSKTCWQCRQCKFRADCWDVRHTRIQAIPEKSPEEKNNNNKKQAQGQIGEMDV